MKAVKTLTVMLLSVCMVFTMMPLGSIQAIAIDEPQQTVEEESSDMPAGTQTDPVEDQMQGGDAEASDESAPADGANQNNTGTEGAATEDSNADKANADNADRVPVYQDIAVNLKVDSGEDILPADKPHELLVAASNPNKDGDALVRLYFWNYDKDFFDKNKRDEVREICDKVTVKDLKGDDTVVLDNNTKDAANVKAELITEKAAADTDVMVRYLEFAIPSNTNYKFNLPLVLEEDVLKNLSDEAEPLHVIIEPAVEGQDEDSDSLGEPVDVQWKPELSEKEDVQEELADGSTADYVNKKGIEAADVSGKAAADQDKAEEALAELTELTENKAIKVAKTLFGAKGGEGNGDEEGDGDGEPSEPETPPSSGDGSSIDVMSAIWITPDTVNNNDDNLLYVSPSKGSRNEQVRLRINYALSGEHRYDPGDIVITLPARLFKDRDGRVIGDIIVPYPEDPSKKADYNWKQVGDNIILTNTKMMSAATKGYFEIAYDGINPVVLKDMGLSDEFVATMELSTHKGNILTLSTEALTAQFDTEATLTDVGKKNRSVTRIKASQVPANQRIPGVEEYIKVDWYVWGTTSANTKYTIDQLDSIPQTVAVETRRVVADGAVTNDKTQISLSDAQQIKPGCRVGEDVTIKTEADVQGFVLGASSAEDSQLEKKNAYVGSGTGRGSDYSFSTVYPANQFEKDVNYTFHNTIKYTLTEFDEEVSEHTNPNVNNGAPDPQKVTTGEATASVTWSYTDPKWINPGGHYMVHKNGNDDTARNNKTHNSQYPYDYSDLHRGGDGYYGIYPSAINKLQDEYEEHGPDGSVRLSYTINTLGYTLPWMYDGGYAEFQEGKIPARIIGNYNRPITMTTTDTGVSFGRNGAKLQVGTDYTYAEIEFPNEPYVYKGSPQNINPDGTWTALDYGDGTFNYTRDYNKANWPDIQLQLQLDGEWVDFARVSWKSGQRVIFLESGAVLTNTGVIPVPEETQNFRTIVTTQNTVGGPEATEALQAGINYDVRPVINLKSTESLVSRFDAMFEQTHLPSMAVYNSTNMLIERADVSQSSDERRIHSINREGYDSIRGYTTDTSVYPYKRSTQNLREVDYENRNILIHYEAYVEERSIINDQKTWQEAVDEKRLLSETSCTWRDLLPKGVTPDLSTIKLRSGDTLVRADTYENYDQSGRTLLVVEAKLKPVPQTYRSGDMTYYMDVPRISFDANYDFESWKDYGSSIHNVIAFESGNEKLGTINGYKGEADNPYGTNNVSTKNAFIDNEEKDHMKNLDASSDKPAFVYAGTTTRIDILAAARTSLYKDVQVNNDGIWSEGPYYEDIYGPPVEATEGGQMRTVYEGGQYTYRLRVMSDPDTVSTGMVIYDALEDFHAKAEDNDPIDAEAVENDALWKGTLREVDTSQLEELGCDPVVYYSTKVRNYNEGVETEYTLTDGDSDLPNDDVLDLTKNHWIKASDYTGPKSEITAVAIDCRRAKADLPAGSAHKDENGYFRLRPMESAVVLLRMHAPSGEQAREIISDKGVWGDSRMAYNNSYLYCASFGEEQGATPSYDEDSAREFIHKDYTKVGMKEYSLFATKKWDDDSDRDGIRPNGKIKFHLYANGEPTGRSETMDIGEGETEVKFEHVPYTDDEGEKIHYTIVEEEIEGYTASYSLDENVFHFTNTHEPEKTSVPGEKTWEGDDEELNRPASIDVELYGNGKKVKTITVKPDARGYWNYEFTNVFKYENGKEIKYTVKEIKTPRTGNALDSYVPTYDENNNILNTYHPFGDLNVRKTVEDTTNASKDKEFTFTFVFNEIREGASGEEEVPVFDEYEYEILDADGNPVTGDGGEAITGTVKTNETVSIKGGQQIHVKEIPQGILYKVTEDEVPGFTLTNKEGDTGAIKPNAPNVASFTNTYSANGQTNLEARKVLEHRKMNKNQFLFELYEVTVDDDGNEVLKPKPSATNDPPDEVEGEGDTIASSSAPVVFGAIRFTHKDDGKTFRYRMNEVDRGKPGYVYTTTIYEAEVSVTDNGDGTLTITTVYKDKDGNPVDTAVFNNKYEAKGNTKLLAWKDLPGRNLTEDEFEFELLDENGDPVMNKGAAGGDNAETPDSGTAVTATNKKDGTVVFDPADVEALNYTQDDIGKTFHYAIREKVGDDDTVTYDETVYGYEIKITDNGDGTLFAEQIPATPIFDVNDPTKIVRWETKDAVLPVFKNKLEDGGLAIQKTVQNSPDADPSQPFTFKVRLIGENIPEGEKEYTITAAGETASGGTSGGDQNASGSKQNDAKADAAPAKKARLPETGDDNAKAEETLKAAAAGDIFYTSGASNPWGVDVRITADGEMIIGNGSTQTFDMGSGHEYVYAPWDGEPYGYSRTYFSRYVKSIRVDGTVNARGSFRLVFDCRDLTNCQKIDLTGMKFDNVSNMSWMIAQGNNLNTIIFGETGTAANANISGMFVNDFYVKEIDMSGFDTSKVTNMSSLFTYTTALEKIHLSPTFQFKNGVQLNTPPTNATYSGKWIRDDEAYGPFTPAQLASNYNASMAGTWIWEENNTDYTIRFTADAPVAGSMNSVSCRAAAAATLPANKFQKHGAEFKHWVVVEKNGTAVENGTVYQDKATIAGGTYKKGDVITLKAVFEPVETKVNIQDGEFEVTLFAGERATFEDIPAGTIYQVYEQTPTGWVLVEQSNVSGSIEPTVTSVASFVNEYQPGVATAQIYGTKTLDRKAAKSGAFQFTLKEGSETLQTVANLDGGFIQFAPITYEEKDVGTHTYTIEEVILSDDTIEYDTHTETVTVEVTKEGDDLYTEVTYEEDGLKFANTTKPGSLKLTKAVEGQTDANDDVEFTFKIKLNNADGMPIGKDDKIYWFTEPNTDSSKVRSLLYNAFDIGKKENTSDIEGNTSMQDAVKAQNAAGEATMSGKGSSAADGPVLRAAADQPPVKAPGDIASGTFRGADWRITSDGTLILGNGGTQTLAAPGRGTGLYGGNPGWPWLSYATRITSVRFDGTVKMTGCATDMFNGCTNLQTFDSEGFDPSAVQSFYRMFNNCRALKYVNADGWVGPNCVNVACMFDQCRNLTKVDTTNWDTSKVVKFWEMFYYCGNLEEIDTRSWVINNVDQGGGKDLSTDLNNMFCYCSKLKDIDTSKWTIYAYEGWYWFGSCSSLRRLDLSNIRRPRSNWSGSCTALTSLSIFTIGPNTFNNSAAQFPTGTWKRVSTGEIKTGAQWNSSWRSTMAGKYVRMTATIYKDGEMVIDWGYDESRTDDIVNTYIIDDTKDTPGWYSDSFKNKITKVTINTEFAPQKTSNWFNGMSSLKQIDGLDNLKMTNLTNMKDMFTGCTALESINLPENFSFKGKNITSTAIQAILPTPTGDGFTGEWVRDDEGYGPMSPADLRDQFNTQMAGTWVWAVDNSIAMITYNGNGGYPVTDRYKTTDPTETVTLPDNKDFTRPHYLLKEWNTKLDGTGTSYEPGVDVDGLLQLGKNKVLYAQWETTELRSYKVEHYQQKADGSGYTLAETDRPDMVVAGTEVTPGVKTYPGYLSPEPQTATVLDDDSLVVKYYYDKLAYTVHFEGNGATAGTMDDQAMLGGTQTPLSPNKFKRDEYLFVGWNTAADGSGKYFIDGQKVRDLTKTNGGTATLYAQWLSKDDAALEPTNGEIIVRCKAGESIVIPELPAGTTYTIEEIDVPDGWSQSGEIAGNNEAIEANVTKYATATNVYAANGEAVIKAHKKLEGAEIQEGQFTFELYNDEELTDLRGTATNGAVDHDANNTSGQGGSNPYYQTSLVEFAPIDYTQEDIGKTFTYYIKETGSSDTMTFDENVYEVKVTVEDAGSGMLETSVTYRNISRTGSEVTETEPIFNNKMKKADLSITKTVDNATEDTPDSEFTFEVELTDASGNVLTGSYETKKVTKGGQEQISHVDAGKTIEVKLRDGETITIIGLPHGTTYKVTEQTRDNWTQTGAVGDSGVLQPGRTSEASFNNQFVTPDKYTAKGAVQFKAKKKVTGGLILEKDNFTFQLTDPEGNVQTKTCDTVSTDDDPVAESTVTFDPITLTLDDLAYTEDDQAAIDQYVSDQMKWYQDQYDADKAAYESEHASDDPPAPAYMSFNDYIRKMTEGEARNTNQLRDKLTQDAESRYKKENDFIYYVHEVPGDDEDVTYDTAHFYYKVHAVDKGDGTIETTVTKWKMGSKIDPDTQESVPDDTQVSGDITFENSKLTQIKAYKEWADHDNIDEIRPTAEEFAASVKLLKNGEDITADVTDAQPEVTVHDDGTKTITSGHMKVTEDKDGKLTIVFADLPAYEDNQEITYTIQEGEFTGYTPKDGVTEAADGETLVNEHTPGTTDLIIQKSLDGYYDGGANSNVTLAFKVEAKNSKGKVIFTGYAGLTFEKGGSLTQVATVKNVPEKAAEITVTEEYASAYDTAAPVTVTEKTDGVWEVTMDNTYSEGPHEGSGIVNRYEDGKHVKSQDGIPPAHVE